jgi:hypothetical protein
MASQQLYIYTFSLFSTFHTSELKKPSGPESFFSGTILVAKKVIPVAEKVTPVVEKVKPVGENVIPVAEKVYQ